MDENQASPLVLPALRGNMGDWVYYSALVDIEQLATRVDFAKEVQPNQALSDMIQRGLDDTRPPNIAEYLLKQRERLFNSLVIATYGGNPNWFALSDITSSTEEVEINGLSKTMIESVGFLTFTGAERLFAVDGQHRLAGMKKAIEKAPNHEWVDEIPVIFVAHRDNVSGLVRSRRLFTTLNKSARPVTKRDTIALDEDDVMAITVRYLIEKQSDDFGGKRIALVAENNMPPGDTTSLTTIGNLYDVLLILFSKTKTNLQQQKKALQNNRPDDEDLQAYFDLAQGFFMEMRKWFPEIEEFFAADDTRPVVKLYRAEGRSILFRPAGLHLFAQVVAQLTREMNLPEALSLASKLPRALHEVPFVGLVWDPESRTMKRFSVPTARDLLLHMLGHFSGDSGKLLESYRKACGHGDLALPDQVM